MEPINKNFLILWNNYFPSLKNLDILSKIVDISEKASYNKCVVIYNPNKSLVTYDNFKNIIKNLFPNVEIDHITNLNIYIQDNTVTDFFIDEEDLVKYEFRLINKNTHIVHFDKPKEENIEDNIDKETNNSTLEDNNKDTIIELQKLSIIDYKKFNNIINSIKDFLQIKDNILEDNVDRNELETFLEDFVIKYSNPNKKETDKNIIEKFISLLNNIKSNKVVISQVFKPTISIEKNIDNINITDDEELSKVFQDSKVRDILLSVLEKENTWVRFGVIDNKKSNIIKYSTFENYIFVDSASDDNIKNYIERSLDKKEIKIMNGDNVDIWRFITPNTSYNYHNFTCIDDILSSITQFINSNFDFNQITTNIVKKYVTKYYKENNLNYSEEKIKSKFFSDDYIKDLLNNLLNDKDDLYIFEILDILLNTEYYDYDLRLLKIVVLGYIYDEWNIIKKGYIETLIRDLFDTSEYSSSLEYKGLNNEQYGCLIRSTIDPDNCLFLESYKYTKYNLIKEKYINDLKDIIQSYYFNISSVLKINEFQYMDKFYEKIKNSKIINDDIDYDTSKLNIGFVYKKVVEEAILCAKTLNIQGKNIFDEKIPNYIQNDLNKLYTLVENTFIELVYDLENVLIDYNKDTENDEKNIKELVIVDIISIIVNSLYLKLNQLEGLK